MAGHNPMNREQCPEYKLQAIKSCKPLLVRCLSLNLTAISDELYAGEFIPLATCEEMATVGVSDQIKAGKLYDHVSYQIKTKPGRLEEFIDIIRSEPSQCNVVEELERRFEDFRSGKRLASFGDDTSEDKSPGQHKRMRLSSTSSHISTSSPKDLEQHGHATLLATRNNNGDSAPDHRAVLEAIEGVSDWRSLGTHLRIKIAKLDEIAKYSPEEQKSKLVAAWFESEENCTWEKLEEALDRPSLRESQAVERVRKRRTSLMSSTLTVLNKDSSIEVDVPLFSPEGDELVAFTEANVLDAVIRVASYHNLGLRLAIPDYKLAEIDQHPPADRRQLLVAALFCNAPKESQNWEVVNSAIKRVEVEEWAAQKQGSMTKSTSFESELSALSTGSIAIDEPSLKLPNKMTKSNTTEIKTEYGKLMSVIKKKLKKAELDMEDFYLHILNIFEPDISTLIPAVPAAEDIDRIFRLLSTQHLWGFGDVSQLKSIAERFIEGDEDLQQKIRDYKHNLSGYRATTKIIDRIRLDEIKENDDDDDDENDEYESIASNAKKYNKKYRKKLSAKLFKSDDECPALLVKKSLEYVEKIWNDLCDEFDISLTAVLDKITSGCIEVTWFIPPQSALKILHHMGDAAVDFFQRKFISNVLLEDVLIYSESCGVAHQKTLTEVHLLLAAQDESLDRISSLLDSHSGVVNAQLTKSDMTALMIIARRGCTEIASALLEGGANVNQQDADGWSAMFHAVSGGHQDMVAHLLEDKEHVAELTLKDVAGSTILDVARKCGHSESHNMLKTKLEHHLVTHAKEGNLKSVEGILQMGVNVDATDPNKELWTPLMWASWHGHLDIVNHLLKFNPNVNAVAKVDGWSALILASREGNCDVMRVLLDHGADIEHRAQNWTSLMNAADKGHTEAGKLLLERGANINCLDSVKYTPLAEACQNGHHQFVKMLMEHDPTLRLDGEPEGCSWTPLMLACRKGHLETAKVLSSHGANVDKAKEDNVTALHIASFAGYSKVVKFLVHMKANVEVTDCFGVTPLLMAIKEGHTEVFKTLVWNGRANLNHQEDKAKHSAPFFAVQCKQNDMLDVLMRNERLDLNVRDIGGNTIRDYAEHYNHEAFVFMKEKYKDKFEEKQPPAAVATRPQQPIVSRKKMINIVNEMMQAIDARMKGGITASAA